MKNRSFSHHEVVTLGEALRIAEEVTSDYYKFSPGQWRRHPYEVKPRAAWPNVQTPEDVFAVLNKGLRTDDAFWPRIRAKDFYFILLQDEKILSAVARDDNLSLLPLMLYVFTHELVHIVRFSRFIQRFEASGQLREEEERLVHDLTFEILRKVPVKGLGYVLDSYEGHRVCRLALGTWSN